MVRAGWLAHGKMVIYPIRNHPDGTQMMNWVAEIETPEHSRNDWSRPGRLEDFLPAFADWHFEWLDVPEMIRNADQVLEYPMVDKDPLPRWSHGRVTLLGDEGPGHLFHASEKLVVRLEVRAASPVSAVEAVFRMERVAGLEPAAG